MNLRTDLATEAVPNTDLPAKDVAVHTHQNGAVTLTYTQIRTEAGAAAVGKPVGQYVTMDLPPLSDSDEQLREHAELLGEELKRLLPPRGSVLVVGLGNESITPDAIGPATARLVLATRHIEGEFARASGLCDLRPTAVVHPGVVGETGVETAELVRGVCRTVRPAAVIAVDALAAASPSRLGTTVQMSDGGIAPGAGVGNHRCALDCHTLGVPVIAIGVPTVVDAASLFVPAAASKTNEEAPLVPPPTEASEADGESNALRYLMVTPREIDLLIHRCARLIAMSIHKALHPAYDPLELMSLA